MKLLLLGLLLTCSSVVCADTITVPASGNLQSAINAAQSGDTIITEGLEYDGNFICNKSLTIQAKTTTILRTMNADPVFYIPPRTGSVVVRNIEFTTNPAWAQVFDIVRYGTTGIEQDSPDEIPQGFTCEGCLVHGQLGQRVQRGIAANGANFTFTKGRIWEIHEIGADSQAICVWNGPGPFLIVDSYLEAAGENFMSGGADPSIPNLIPSNISILRNHFFKPLSWKVGDPSYAGIHWSIKNLLELKLARNVTIDGNTLENSWGDAQIGYGALFTVRNQDGHAPWATIENVTFTNNVMRNTEQGFQLLGFDNLQPSQRASGLVIRNNLFTGIKNRFLTMTAYANVTVEHNTSEQGGNIMSLYGEQSPGFVYVNNVTLRHDYGIFGDIVGEGTVALETYAKGYDMRGNVIAGAIERLYPVGNFYPADLSNIGSFTGTDGLPPGYSAGGALPTPSPSPTVQPSPVPSPTVAPTPLPSPSPTPAPTPCSMTITVPTLEQWTTGIMQVNIQGTSGAFTVSAVGITGQVVVAQPTSKALTGTSALVQFQLSAKKKSAAVNVSGPCGAQAVMVEVR